ncbi:uncharacterized protein LOC110041294 [Orbicella faveolata]|uniref:uncharacterized protein LOC110041294 n=1 Tax=Orbicella faveolata TaxID=48498 RepID=UPI0009E5EF20|nr:uncharacterized protein LOC110041294 [Orbicella faveolata]
MHSTAMNHFIVFICLVAFREAVGRSPLAVDSSHGFKEKRSLPTRQLLVGYWGQNAIGTRVSRQYWEKNLRYFCNNHKFDVYLVAFVHRLFRNNRNRDRIPGMNFAHHCSYPMYKCHQVDIKLVIIAEVAQVLLPVLSADSCSNSILSPVANQKLACWKGALFLKTMT